jgi:hypothetical protein
MLDLGTLWLRAQYAPLLVSAKGQVAAGNYKVAQKKIERIFHLYEQRGISVPINADIMRALIAWNMKDYDDATVYVRRAADKLGQRLLLAHPKRSNELQYLRAYCWTLLYYSEAAGAVVRWNDFADLVPASYVNLTKISRTTREMFPVDEEVFAPAQPH